MAQQIFKSPTEQARVLAERPQFQPTKETIWDNPKHPLYSIAPNEQNEDFLNSAIAELERNTKSPEHWEAYSGANGGGTREEAIKKLTQYKKALKFINDWRDNAQWDENYFGSDRKLPF